MNFVNDSLQDIETAILRKKVGCVGSQPLPDHFQWCFGSYASRDLGIFGHFEASDWNVPARRGLDDADWKELQHFCRSEETDLGCEIETCRAEVCRPTIASNFRLIQGNGKVWYQAISGIVMVAPACYSLGIDPCLENGTHTTPVRALCGGNADACSSTALIAAAHTAGENYFLERLLQEVGIGP